MYVLRSKMAESEKEAPAPLVEETPPAASVMTRSLRSRDRTPFASVVKPLEDPEKGGPDYAATKRGSEKRKVIGEPVITTKTTPKRKKVFGPEDVEEFQDVYCWECHKLCIESSLDCHTCPRTFHQRCVSAAESFSAEDWTCPVCNAIMRAECASSRSWAMQMLTVEKFSTLLAFALQRMKHGDSEPFQHPVPRAELPDYYEVVFHPMDLQTLAINSKKKIYASTEAFLEDAKWILHNCIIYNGPSSKYVADAKLIIKICKHEMTEIEICPDCYLSSSIRKDNWFTEPCTYPHCLVWAKLKGFPYWPAKALRISGSNNVDVRFFGAHDRSWIPITQCFLLSEECPVQMKSAKKYGLEQATQEVQLHIQRIKEKFGFFQYAPMKTEFAAEDLYTCEVLFGTDIHAKVPDCGSGSDRRQRVHAGFSSEFDGDCSLEQMLNETRSPRRPDSGSSLENSVADQLSSYRPGKASSKQDVEQERASAGGSMGRQALPEKAVASKNTTDIESGTSDLNLGEENTAGVFTLDSSLEEEIRDLPSIILPENADCGITRAVLDLSRENSELESIAARILKDPSEETVDVSGTNHEPKESGTTVTEPEGFEPGHKRPASTKTSQAQKKRSLTSCLQKLTQTQTQNQKPGTASNGTNSEPKAAVSSSPVVTNDEPMVTDRCSLLSRYTGKISAAVMGALEELLTEMDENEGSSSAPNATASTLETKTLRAEVNRITWLQKQAISELEHNTKLAVAEMQEQMVAERQRMLEEQKRRIEAEWTQKVIDTKRKQWCANCGKEAMFYCCWNTSYCDYPCQQQHWPKHQETCAQIRHQNTESQGTVSQGAMQNSYITHGPVSVGGNIFTPQPPPSSTGQVTVQFVPGMVPVVQNHGSSAVSVYAHGPQVPGAGQMRPPINHGIPSQSHFPAMQPRPGAGTLRRR